MSYDDRWLFCTDPHGDLICESARNALYRFRDKFKPSRVIVGGDLFDMRALRKNATEEERNEGISGDIKCGLDFLRDVGATDLLLGNHDFRLIDRAERCADGKLREYCRMLVGKIEDECETLKCTIYPYDVENGVLEYGDYRFIHGYNHGIHSADAAGKVFGNVIMGHVHTFQRSTVTRFDQATAWACGMMADPARMGYARRSNGFLRWRQGWMYGWNREGKLHINTVEGANGTWYYPTKFNV